MDRASVIEVEVAFSREARTTGTIEAKHTDEYRKLVSNPHSSRRKVHTHLLLTFISLSLVRLPLGVLRRLQGSQLQRIGGSIEAPQLFH